MNRTGVVIAVSALCVLGCETLPYTAIAGSQTMLPSYSLSFRADFRRAESWKQTMFMDYSWLEGVVENARIRTDMSSFQYDGELLASFFRAGVEHAWLLGPERRYEAGLSFGFVSGLSLDFDYYDAGSPDGRELTEWGPSLFVLSPGVFWRAKMDEHVTLKVEASSSLFVLTGHVAECAAGIELRSGGFHVTVGWRYLDVFASRTTSAEDLEMDFRLSGPTVVLGYTF